MRWVTGTPDRSGARVYTHLIRHPGDPEATRNGDRATRDFTAQWRRDMSKQEAGSWRIRVRNHLRSYGPMSFQRLCVTMLDRDADTCFGTLIVWQLVAAGTVQWSLGLPKFRVSPTAA